MGANPRGCPKLDPCSAHSSMLGVLASILLRLVPIEEVKMRRCLESHRRSLWFLVVLLGGLSLCSSETPTSARKHRRTQESTQDKVPAKEAAAEQTSNRAADSALAPIGQAESTAAEKTEPQTEMIGETTIRVLRPANGATISTDSLAVELAVRPMTGAKVARVVAEVLGQTVAQEKVTDSATRGVVLSMPTVHPGELFFRLSISIPEGNTQITLRAETDRGTSVPTLLSVKRVLPQQSGFLVKPRLNLLAVGISSYEKRTMSLTYPSKDASDLTTVLSRQQGKLYREVNTRLLVNEKATKAAILDGLDWIQRQTTAHDIAMVFFAGHGVNDPSTGRYYFLPYDADPEAVKRTMLAQEEVQSTLRSIPGKVLLFLDTCHSGNVMGQWNLRGDADMDTFLREMNTADSGVVVFAASTGRQSSKESDAWQNGAFTRALVEGLLGAAAYMKGRPVTINMLDLFLSERVKALTRGTQSPTTAKPSNIQDFPIAMPEQDSPLQLSDAAMAVMPSIVKPETPVYKKWWVWTLVGIGVAGVVSAGVVAGTWQSVPGNVERIPLTRP